MVRTLAKLHGAFWNSPRLKGDLSWLQTSYQFQEMLNALGFEERCNEDNERASRVFAPELYQRKDDIFPLPWRSHEIANDQVQTLLHNDVHIGNWYRTPDNRVGLADWQGLVKGNFGSDLAYALSSALTIEDRRAWERELIELYVEKLREQNIENPPDFNQAWLCYRQQYFHALVFWTFTIGQGPLQSDMQPDEYSLINLERMSAAMVDLESLDSIK